MLSRIHRCNSAVIPAALNAFCNHFRVTSVIPSRITNFHQTRHQLSSFSSSSSFSRNFSSLITRPGESHLPPSRYSYYLPNSHRRYNSSFIRQVMDQVKKEMETNEKLRKSVKEFKDSGVKESSSEFKQHIEQTTEKIKETSQKLRDSAGSIRSSTSGIFVRVKERANQMQQTYNKFKEESPFLMSVSLISNNVTSLVIRVVKVTFSKIMSGTGRVLEFFKDEKVEEAKKRAEKWRAEMEKKREGVEQKESSADETETIEAEEATYALIVAQDSAWDRFGTKLRDMPFLHNFFENPMIGKLLGESAQAAALREMKALDPSFRLPELVELTEHVIAPHLVHSFLNGDRESLRSQCGEAAFGAIDHSIKERETLKLSLDPTVLLLRNVEFKGASAMPDKTPWFIFTFTAQQINCMRDKDGKVVIGAIDDIREVIYSVALTKHPNPEQPGLDYPWQVTEFAIIGNTPCW